MHRRAVLALALATAALFAACGEGPVAPDATPEVVAPFMASGNGAPQGAPAYQLNVIGTTDKNPDMTGDNGRRIFVPLEGKTKILLWPGDYAVLDANATDGEGAFQLPRPGLDAYLIGDPGDADVESDYSVYIRPLGKPGGFATITTCAELLDSNFNGLLPNNIGKEIENRVEGDAYCSIEQVGGDPLVTGDDRLYRDTGKSSFKNVTAELLTIVFEVTIETAPGVFETVYVRVPIFDALLEGEYWEYDNNGLRLAQIRFYDCSTNVETGESTCS